MGGCRTFFGRRDFTIPEAFGGVAGLVFGA